MRREAIEGFEPEKRHDNDVHIKIPTDHCIEEPIKKGRVEAGSPGRSAVMMSWELILAWNRVVEVEEKRINQILGIFSSLKDLLVGWIWGMTEQKGFKDDLKISFNFLVLVFWFLPKKMYCYCHYFIFSDIT